MSHIKLFYHTLFTVNNYHNNSTLHNILSFLYSNGSNNPLGIDSNSAIFVENLTENFSF